MLVALLSFTAVGLLRLPAATVVLSLGVASVAYAWWQQVAAARSGGNGWAGRQRCEQDTDRLRIRPAQVPCRRHRVRDLAAGQGLDGGAQGVLQLQSVRCMRQLCGCDTAAASKRRSVRNPRLEPEPESSTSCCTPGAPARSITLTTSGCCS